MSLLFTAPRWRLRLLTLFIIMYKNVPVLQGALQCKTSAKFKFWRDKQDRLWFWGTPNGDLVFSTLSSFSHFPEIHSKRIVSIPLKWLYIRLERNAESIKNWLAFTNFQDIIEPDRKKQEKYCPLFSSSPNRSFAVWVINIENRKLNRCPYSPMGSPMIKYLRE